MKDLNYKKQLIIAVMVMVTVYLYDHRDAFLEGIRMGINDVFGILLW